MNKIEGGPECEECEGTGYLQHRPATDIPCPDCEGGIKPLSEWTDAQKAEWLKEHNPDKYNMPCTWNMGGAWQVGYYDFAACEFDTKGMNDDFSAALTAAVECVAKERDA